MEIITDFDLKMMRQAKTAASKSTCRKKPLGCVLVCVDENGDPTKTYEGWNGPPENVGFCALCPKMNAPSGTLLHLCPAVHAERRCLLHAARDGVSTRGAILYSFMGVPCKDCLVELAEAEISEIVCLNRNYYDGLAESILGLWLEGDGTTFRVITEEEIGGMVA